MSLHDEPDGRTDEASEAGTAARSLPASIRRRWLVPVVAAVLVAVAAVAVSGHRGRQMAGAGDAIRTSDPRGVPSGLDAHFAALRVARTNRCSLQASELGAMDPNDMLQGSCCSPMDRQAYAEQRGGLMTDRAEPTIPRDPYDIGVGLARRLVAYRAIALTGPQQASYDRAVARSRLSGPCCCHCWRWDAFEGQAKYLITARGYDAAQVASVWDLEDGCGGRPARRGTT